MIRELKQIFEEDGRRPVRFQSDQGKEYTNEEFLKDLKSIHFLTTRNIDSKANIVERFQRESSNVAIFYPHQDPTLCGHFTRFRV